MTQHATKGGAVMELIVRMVGDGRLVPGQRLVESRIARELGVGTMPVREALRMLAGDGVVDIIPNRGASLRAMPIKEIIDTLRGVTALLLVALDSLRQADAKALAPKLRLLTGQIMTSQGKHDGQSLFAGAAEYQQLLIAAADNVYVSRMMGRLHFSHFIGQILAHVDIKELEAVARRYEAITQAMETGDMASVKLNFAASQQALERLLDTRSP